MRLLRVALAASAVLPGCLGGPAVDQACHTERPADPSAARLDGGAGGTGGPGQPLTELSEDDDLQAEWLRSASKISMHLDDSVTVIDEALIRRATLPVLADIGELKEAEEDNLASLEADLQFRLLDEYKNRGYHHAEVEVHVGPLRDKGTRRVDISAVEGAQVMVDAVEIVGARAIDPAELQDYYLDFADPVVPLFGRSVYIASVADDAARRMVERYAFEGYPDATARVVETIFRDSGVVIRYAVGEGPRAWLKTIRWRALSPPGRAQPEQAPNTPLQLRLEPWEIREQLHAAGVREGVLYSPGLAGTARAALAGYYGEQGFPFALVQAVETRRERDRNGDWQVTLELLIFENDIAAVCRVGVQGNHWTQNQVILREVAPLQGMTYTASQVRDAQRAIARLGIFKSVQVRRTVHKVAAGAAPRPDLVDLDIEVAEQDWVVARIDLGFASVEGLRAAPTVDFPNFTGWGHSGQVRALVSPLRQRVEGKLTSPWTFGLPFRTRIETSWEDRPEPLSRRPSFRAEEARAAVTFSRPLIGDLEGFVGYEAETTRVFDPADGFLIQSSIGTSVDATVDDLRLSAVNIGWVLDGRDNRFSPKAGAYATMSYTFAGDDLGGNVSFQRLQGTIAMYHTTGPFTVAFRGDSAAVDYSRSAKFPKLPPPYRIFSGGARSVRSFAQGELGPLTIDDPNTVANEGGSPLGGLGHGVINAELRTRLWPQDDGPFGISALPFSAPELSVTVRRTS